MTDRRKSKSDSEPLQLEEGHYLYCVVDADSDVCFSAEGIEGGSVSLLVSDGLGAVIQPVESVYDSGDMTQVRRWLLTHQSVVDDAGEAFGTPLPFRFDTIFEGTDEAVLEWLQTNHEELQRGLDWLAGRWEYRTEIRWDETAVGERLRADDAELRELARRIETSDSGTAYLLESQYENRLREQLQARRNEIEQRLIEEIEPYVVEIEHSGESRSIQQAQTDLDTAVALSVLAPSEHEEQIGSVLEDFAAEYDVRYTGPWPPYSHAPAIGGETES